MSGKRLVGLLLGACLLLGGCGPAPEAEGERRPTTLRINYSAYPGFAPVVIAQAEGCFADQGIELELITLRASSRGLPALVRGDLDVLVGAVMPGVLNTIARGASIKMVADRGSVPSGGPPMVAAFVTPSVAQRGPLDDPATLRGLKVATMRGTPTTYFLHRLLARSGLDLDDVEVSEVPIAARVDAMRRSTVDAVTAPAPWWGQLMESDYAVLWGADSQVIPGFQYSYVAFGPRLLEQDVELGERFVVAFLAGVRQYNEGKTERNLDILTRHMPYDREMLMRTGWTEVRPDGRLDVADVLEFQRWAMGRGLIDRVLAPEEFWDPRFVEHAARVATAALDAAEGR